jgi:hypothetical protein
MTEVHEEAAVAAPHDRFARARTRNSKRFHVAKLLAVEARVPALRTLSEALQPDAEQLAREPHLRWVVSAGAERRARAASVAMMLALRVFAR